MVDRSGENVFCEANHGYEFYFYVVVFFPRCKGYQSFHFALIGIVVAAVVEAQKGEGLRNVWLTFGVHLLQVTHLMARKIFCSLAGVKSC